MGFVDIDPDATYDDLGSRTVVGAASPLAALQDASDASYVQLTSTVANSWQSTFRFANPSIPAGASITAIQPVWRYSHYVHAGGFGYEILAPRATFMGHASGAQTIFSMHTTEDFPYYWTGDLTTVTEALGTKQTMEWRGQIALGYNYATQRTIQGYDERFYVWVSTWRPAAFNTARIYRLRLRVYYDEQPVLNITSPTGGTIQTARPQFVWSYSDPENSQQELFDIRIWTKADADNPNFNGLIALGDPSFPPLYQRFVTSPNQNHLVEESFADNGVEYSAFIRARSALIWPRSQYNVFITQAPSSVWDRVDFVTDFDGPQQPTLIALANPADHSIAVDLTGIDNMLDFNQSTLEELTTDGWVAGANTTLANSSAQFLSGARSLSFTRTTSVGDALANAAVIPVVGGDPYTGMAFVRANTTGRAASVAILYSDNVGLVGGSSSSITTTDVTTGWRQVLAWGVAPANALYATIIVTFTGCAVGEVHYVDQAGIFPGTRINLLSDNQASLEDGVTTGWAGGTNTTVAAVKLGSEDAYDREWVLRLTRTTSTGDGTATTPTGTSGVPVQASTAYTIAALFRAPVTTRSVRVDVTWYTAAGAVISTTNGNLITNSTSAWTVSAVGNTTSPGTAAFAAIVVTVQGMAVSEQQYVDGVGIWRQATIGPVPAWTMGGFLHDDPSIHQMELQRSLDAGVTWETLPEQRVEHIPLQQALHYHDFEIPSGGEGHYRGRIVAPNHEGEVVNSPWSAIVSDSLPNLTRYYLRDPLDSTGMMTMTLRVVSLDLEHPKPASQGFPLGSEASAVTHRGIRHPDVRLVVDLLNEDDYMMFHDLMDSGNVLLMQDVIGHQYYLQLLSLSEERLRALAQPAESWPVRHAHRATAVFASVDRDTSFALHSAGMGTSHG